MLKSLVGTLPVKRFWRVCELSVNKSYRLLQEGGRGSTTDIRVDQESYLGQSNRSFGKRLQIDPSKGS